MERNLTYSECINSLVELQKNAQKRIIEALEPLSEKNKFIIPKYDGKTGVGVNTIKNDRRLFVWIPINYKDNEYLITLFYNEIDERSGNCHSQIGRVQFVKGINESKYISSPNTILKKGNYEKEEATRVEFNSYKWKNPLDYMDGEFTNKMCENGKWITIDDVNHNEQVPNLIAKALEKFIETA